MTVDERVGANVHQLMWQRKVRTSQMCEHMGISRSLLARKMRGETVWFARDIEAAARLLNVEPGRLFAVAGAGFEPATSGLRAHPSRLATIIPFPRTIPNLERAS